MLVDSRKETHSILAGPAQFLHCSNIPSPPEHNHPKKYLCFNLEDKRESPCGICSLNLKEQIT
jgi:hypothetical protein